MGLAGRALMLNLEPADVGAGLVLPKAAFQLMGKGGAGCALLIVFMAVTSVGPFPLLFYLQQTVVADNRDPSL